MFEFLFNLFKPRNLMKLFVVQAAILGRTVTANRQSDNASPNSLGETALADRNMENSSAARIYSELNLSPNQFAYLQPQSESDPTYSINTAMQDVENCFAEYRDFSVCNEASQGVPDNNSPLKAQIEFGVIILSAAGGVNVIVTPTVEASGQMSFLSTSPTAPIATAMQYVIDCYRQQGNFSHCNQASTPIPDSTLELQIINGVIILGMNNQPLLALTPTVNEQGEIGFIASDPVGRLAALHNEYEQLNRHEQINLNGEQLRENLHFRM